MNNLPTQELKDGGSHVDLTDQQIQALQPKQLIDYAISMYTCGQPVQLIMNQCGLTRTRLYNQMRKRGISPNRQAASMPVTLDNELLSLYNEAREEIGALKFQLNEARRHIVDLEAR